MGLGGPNLVKGAVGQVIDAESLGGARLHTTSSGVAHYSAKDDAACLSNDPATVSPAACCRRAPRRFETRREICRRVSTMCCRPITGCRTHRRCCSTVSSTPRLSRISARARAGDALRDSAPQRPSDRCDRQSPRISENRGGPRIGGIVYTESARKVAYFVENAERHRLPLIYLQDVSGFMVGVEAEARRHHPRRRRDGGNDGLRHRSEDRSHAQSRQRRGLLRDGRPGLRSELHVQLAHRAHRRDGRRFRGAGGPWSGTRKTEDRRPAGSRGTAESRSNRPAPITSAGSMRNTPRRADTATPSSIRKIRGKY